MSRDFIEKTKDGHRIRFDRATSERMAGVRRHGTSPERVVRTILTELGHRYRVTNRGLPGSPDIANRSRRWAIFVHGCFWHRHGCAATTTPKRNRAFWQAKFRRNVERDAARQEALRDLGYRVVVVWECETKREVPKVVRQLRRALPRPRS